MLIKEDCASLVTHLAEIAMMVVQAPAQNVAPKMTESCYFCIRVSARLFVQVVFLEKQQAKNANLVMQPAAVVLVLHHLSACLAVRDFLR